MGGITGPREAKLYLKPPSLCQDSCERSSFLLRCQMRLRTECTRGKMEGKDRTRKARVLQHEEQEQMQV